MVQHMFRIKLVFVSGQARLDGAFCGYTPEDKYEYLLQLKEAGVSNIEMEATCFAALTHMAGFRAAIVCVTLVNRLDEDQVRVLFIRHTRNKKFLSKLL